MALSLLAVLSSLAIGLTYSPPAGRAEVPDVLPVQAAMVEPGPVDTPFAAEALAFAAAPAPEPAPESAPPAPAPNDNPCADALTWVAEAGLLLPAGVDYLCPSTMFAHQGTACWRNGIYCPGGGLVAINMDRLQGASTSYLRYVVAHEVCHIQEFQAKGWTTEPSADACAAAHGAPA